MVERIGEGIFLIGGHIFIFIILSAAGYHVSNLKVLNRFQTKDGLVISYVGC